MTLILYTIIKGSRCANLFSPSRVFLIKHLIYLSPFVLFNSLEFVALLTFLCWIVVLLKKREKKEIWG